MKTPGTLTNPVLITLGAFTLAACGGQTDSPDTGASLLTTPDTNAPEIIATPDREPRVVGGTEVTSNKYPWMVAVMDRDAGSPSDGQFCGGSLIAENWVLTAAHCIEDKTASKVSVLLGQRDLSGSGGDTINVIRIVAHPDYQRQGYPDLALLELGSNSAVTPVSLPTRANPAGQSGDNATVIGWGQISENGPATNELRETTMPIVAHNQCNVAYNGEIVEDAMVCAGTPSGNKDSCYGDSGGPLLVARGQSAVQTGVVSFGEACGLANVPGVYARVSSYHDWISAYANVTTYSGGATGGGGATDPTTPTPQIGIDVSCEALSCTMTASNFGTGDYYWDFGDGFGDEGSSVTHQYDAGGDYVVYFGYVSADGEYTEANKDITVTGSTDTVNPVTTEIPQIKGRLRGRGDQIDLPRDGGAITMSAGSLNATLSVPKKRRFVLYVDRYDSATDDWYEVAKVRSKRGSAVIDMPIEAGEYGFTVMSLGRGGKYTLDASVK